MRTPLLAWLTVGLLLIGSLPARATDAFSRQLDAARQSLDQLSQLLRDPPEHLTVSIAHQPSALLRGLPYACAEPTLLGLGEHLRAISNCAVAGERAVMLWESRDGQWVRGWLLASQRTPFGHSAPAPHWQDLRHAAPWTLDVSGMSPRQMLSLQEFWARLAEQRGGFEPLLAQAPRHWPLGMVGIHRDGRLLLANQELGGLSAWQQWMAQQQWPETALGVISAEVSPRSGERRPSLLLGMLPLGRTTYSAALIEGNDVVAPLTLWSDGHRHLVLEPLLAH